MTPYKIVVFDDDPTGIQTVHGCLLVTDWSHDNLRIAFQDPQPFFYVLTNSRALSASDAKTVLTAAVEAVLKANEEFGFRLICISRSDSCLRGHFPLETDIMRQVLTSHGISVWPRTTFCPAFIESGRVTIDGTHYMIDGDRMIPTSETEFARDNVFGYSTSVLTDYIREKGGNPADYDIVNAQSYAELDAYRDKLMQQVSDWDGAVVIRSSSSLPRSMSRIPDKPLLTKADLFTNLPLEGGPRGVFIVGSHVKKTTIQLQHLLDTEGTAGIELPIDRILNDSQALLAETLNTMLHHANNGLTPVVYTARKEVRINDAEARQHLGQTVSDFLVSIVRNLPYTPAYLVAKGGITSHDILTHGLNVKVGRVMGQAINSVPCIMATHHNTPLPYIIFPGNVGNDLSLKEIYQKLS